MDTMQIIANVMANRDKEPMVFDWDKAARLIRESGAQQAEAGLRGDWGCTGGQILEEGKPDLESYTYLSSAWAVPELSINGGDRMPCFVMTSAAPGVDAHTKWPPSALAILEGKP